MDMGAGHFSVTGRFERLKEVRLLMLTNKKKLEACLPVCMQGRPHIEQLALQVKMNAQASKWALPDASKIGCCCVSV